MALCRLLVLALISIGCGHDTAPQTPDASVAVDGASDAPLTAPADTWTWIPVAGSRCVHGAETGIAINPHPGATRLLVFFQGGGSCTHCWGKTEADRVGTPTHYDAASFAVEPDVGAGGAGGQLLLRRDSADNPLADANLVFIPYCTGDLHAGTATRSEIGEDGLEHEDARRCGASRCRPAAPAARRRKACIATTAASIPRAGSRCCRSTTTP